MYTLCGSKYDLGMCFPAVSAVCTWLHVYMCAHIFMHHVPMLAPVMFMHQACMHIYSVEFKCMCHGAYLSQACMFQYMCVHQTRMCTHALHILCLCLPHVELGQSFDSPSPRVSGTAPPIY